MSHLLFILIGVSLVTGGYGQFIVPEIQVQALSPTGILVSAQDNGMQQFMFHGQINDDRRIDGDAKLENFVWIFEDETVELKENDKINFWVFAQNNNLGFRKHGLSVTIKKLVTRDEALKNIVPTTTTQTGGSQKEPCYPTTTVVTNGRPCRGKVIFEDNFLNDLSRTKWIIEQKLADDEQENSFVSYQPLAVSIEHNKLKISPKFQTQESSLQGSLSNGTLDLRIGCTSINSDYCYKQSSGFDIIPPIISGRISTRNSFNFKYGRIDIKAKIPLGDWIYPELLLMPSTSSYGSSGYDSGVIRIAFSRGNRNLQSETAGDLSSKVLSGGILLNQVCRSEGIVSKTDSQPWGQVEHEYSVVWQPDRLTFFVDKVEYGTVVPPPEGFKKYLDPPECEGNKGSRWSSGTPIAPFDKEFHIVLGIGVGGVADFPDDIAGKPWENTSPKAMNTFRKNPDWIQTWGDTNKLLIDSVKVTAL